MADETADILRTEQLTVGVRYVRFDQENKQLIIRVCQESLGHTPLQELY